MTKSSLIVSVRPMLQIRRVGVLGRVGANIDTLSYTQKRELLAGLDVQVTLYPAAHIPRYTTTATLPLDNGGESWDIVYPTHPRTRT